jgi:SAM-dependent methyltransferase
MDETTASAARSARDPRAGDVWESAVAYERFMGRWSRPIAEKFLRWLDAPHGADWLDVGCGPGALVETVLSRAVPRSVFGCDSAVAYVRHARVSISDPRAGFEVGDAMRLPFPHGAFDVVVSGLALNFMPDPEAALREMNRVAHSGGLVAAYVWDYPGEMQILRVFWDSAVELEPGARELHEGRRFALCSPHRLEDLFRDAGLADVDAEPIETFARFRGFDDFWLPFLEGQGPAPSYVAALSGDRQAELRDRIRGRLPVLPDGSITLATRAWAVRGIALAA